MCHIVILRRRCWQVETCSSSLVFRSRMRLSLNTYEISGDISSPPSFLPPPPPPPSSSCPLHHTFPPAIPVASYQEDGAIEVRRASRYLSSACRIGCDLGGLPGRVTPTVSNCLLNGALGKRPEQHHLPIPPPKIPPLFTCPRAARTSPIPASVHSLANPPSLHFLPKERFRRSGVGGGGGCRLGRGAARGAL